MLTDRVSSRTLKTLVTLCALILALFVARHGYAKRSLGEAISDEVIAFHLNAKFAKDKIVPAKDILIGVKKGVVTLRGELKTQEQINRAIEIAELQKGVKEVKAFLVLKEFGNLREDDTAQNTEKKSFFKSLLPSRSKEAGHQVAKSNSRLKEKTLHDTNNDSDTTHNLNNEDDEL